MTALIALGWNQLTLIAALFLILALVFGGITLAAWVLEDMGRSLDGFLSAITTRYGPGVQHRKGKPGMSHVFFGILAVSAFLTFLVIVFG